jgi:molybdate transport system regulatory protein
MKKPSVGPTPMDAPFSLPQALSDASVDKRIEVLRCVATGASISQAARETGISYKAAWQAIDTLSNLSGQTLVDRTVGGAGGGGASITAKGRELLLLADELDRARQQVLTRFGGRQRPGAGLGLRTSMRNQLPCEVDRLEHLSDGDPMTTVWLRTPGPAVLRSSLTRESADLLGLVPGLQVLVLCKATAVVMAPQTARRNRRHDGGLDDDASSELVGTVERVAHGESRDEVVLALTGGGHWVGFVAHPSTLKPGHRACARMPSSSLVVALAS